MLFSSRLTNKFISFLTLITCTYCVHAVEVIQPIDLSETGDLFSSTKNVKQDESISQSLTFKHALQIQDIYGDESRVAIPLRGFGDNASTNTLIVVNGQPLRRPDLALPSLLGIEHSSIEEIEVLNQSGGVLYGDQAVGGVIEIKTDPFKRNRKAIELTQGSSNANTIHPFISHVDKNLPSFYLTGQYQESDNDLPDNYERIRFVNSGAQGYLGSAKLSLEHSYRDQKLFFPGPMDKNGRQTNPQANGQEDFNLQAVQSWDQKFNLPINNLWDISIQSVFNRMTGNGRLTSLFDESSESTFINSKVSGELNIGSWVILPLLGTDFDDAEYNFKTSTYHSTVSQKMHSYYSQIQVPLFETTMITAGYRYSEISSRLKYANRFNKNDHVHVKALGITQDITPWLQLTLRYAENFRFAKPEENAFTLNQQPLQTQQGYSYETGINYQVERFRWNIAAYQLHTDNEIFFIPKDQSGVFASNRNIKQTIHTGVSISTAFEPISRLTTGISYHYVDPKIKGGQYDDKFIPLVSEHSVSLNNNYQLLPGLDFYTYLSFFSSRYIAGDYLNRVSKVPGYMVADSGLRYRWKNLRITMDIKNIFDKLYYTNVVSTQATDDAHTFYYPAAGRAYHLAISYDFK